MFEFTWECNSNYVSLLVRYLIFSQCSWESAVDGTMSGEFDLSEEEGCEESDLCRGYGDLSNDLDKLYVGGSYDPDSIVGAADGSKPNAATEDDFAPEMPVDFYQSVEVFLAKAPPRLSDCVSKETRQGVRCPGADVSSSSATDQGQER